MNLNLNIIDATTLNVTIEIDATFDSSGPPDEVKNSILLEWGNSESYSFNTNFSTYNEEIGFAYNTTDVYEIQVTITDDNGSTQTESLTLDLTDVPESELKFAVSFIIDESGSMEGTRADSAQAATNDLIDNLSAAGELRHNFITFSSDVKSVQPSDETFYEDPLEKYTYDIGGGTSYSEAIEKTHEIFNNNLSELSDFKKVIILIGDGLEYKSPGSEYYEQKNKEAHEMGIDQVWGIGLEIDQSTAAQAIKPYADLLYFRLAEDANDLDGIYEDINESLNNDKLEFDIRNPNNDVISNAVIGIENTDGETKENSAGNYTFTSLSHSSISYRVELDNYETQTGTIDYSGGVHTELIVLEPLIDIDNIDRYPVYKTVASGNGFISFINNDKKIKSYGYDFNGQVRYTPKNDQYKQISAGEYHLGAIKNNNQPFMWGRNLDNQLEIKKEYIKKIALGKNHTLFLDSNNYIKGYGDDTHSQISNIPDQKFIDIAAGDGFSVGIDSNNNLLVWGDDSSGLVTDKPSDDPDQKFIYVDAKGNNAIALKEDGTVSAWGDNTYSQNTLIGSDYIFVSSGIGYNLLIREDGTVRTKGDEPITGMFDIPTDHFYVAADCSSTNIILIDHLGNIIITGDNSYDQNINDTFGVIIPRKLKLESGIYKAYK